MQFEYEKAQNMQHARRKLSHHAARAIAQEVSRWLPTAAARVQNRV
jgi:hypothetical protein